MNDDFDTLFEVFLDEFSQLKAAAGIDDDQRMAKLMNESWPTPPSPEDETFSQHPPSANSSPASEPRLRKSDSALENLQNSALSTRENKVTLDQRIACTGTSVPEAPKSGRKGHKKSRAGCFTCKRRKIKCQENQPICRNCTLKSLDCTWPTPKTLNALQASASYSPNPVTSVNLQSTPTIFTLTDMRLFHHYLSGAYPHLPVGNEKAWISHIPLVAHHNEYLMHAILAVAASHLDLLQNRTTTELSSIALRHRILAIQGSNKALSAKLRTGSDGDALLGACYLLLFQSSYMVDGISEFWQFIRGCHILDGQLRNEKPAMAFNLREGGYHFEFMKTRLANLPIINPEILQSAEKGLNDLQGTLEKPAHLQFYRLLITCVQGAQRSSLEAYFKFIQIYQVAPKMNDQEFSDFIDPTNLVSRLLLAYFFAIQTILLPILDREWAGRSRATPLGGTLQWIQDINRMLPEHLRKYMEWPVAIADACFDELRGVKAPVPRVEVLRKKEGFSRDIV